MLKKFLFITMMVCGLVGTSQAGQLSATIEPRQIAYGDSVKFELVYEGDDAGTIQPDLSALNKDFAIYSTSSSMQSSYVNGVGHQKRIWSLLLMPKSEGKLTIPAISAGSYQTAPLELEVLPTGAPVSLPSANGQGTSVGTSMNNAAQPQNNTSQNAQGSFWAELTVDNKNPYINQEITATLVIYDQRGVEMQMPTFDDSQDWQIEVVGNPEITEKSGQRIVKIVYSMVPQKAGALSVPSARIEGTYTDFSSTPVSNSLGGLMKLFQFNFNMSDMLGTQKPVMVRTKPIAVSVKPIPEDYGNYWWLPADALAMSAKWSDARPVFKIGEAVTREITVLASGVAAEDLPELSFKDNPAWKQYPEKPQLNTVIHQGKRIAQAITRVVYIPQKSGEQELPEVKLRWYNVKTNHVETATIPAEKFYVAGSETVASTQPIQPDAATSSADKSAEHVEIKHIEHTANNLMQWIWIGLAFIAGLVLSTLFLRRKSAPSEENMSALDYVKKTEQALQKCDYRLLRDNLLHWGEQMFPDKNIANLNDLSALVGDEEFGEQMLKLSGILYAGKQEELNSDVILSALKHNYKKIKQKREKPLPDLYK